jgi:hypothetical protein
MSYREAHGTQPRLARHTRWRAFLDFAWKMLRAILVVGAAFGPSVPPPPPPPPQTIETKSGDASPEREP